MMLADSGAATNKASSQTDLTTSALMILSEINRKYPAEMKYNGLQIMVNINILLTIIEISRYFQLKKLDKIIHHENKDIKLTHFLFSSV